MPSPVLSATSLFSRLFALIGGVDAGTGGILFVFHRFKNLFGSVVAHRVVLLLLILVLVLLLVLVLVFILILLLVFLVLVFFILILVLVFVLILILILQLLLGYAQIAACGVVVGIETERLLVEVNGLLVVLTVEGDVA